MEGFAGLWILGIHANTNFHRTLADEINPATEINNPPDLDGGYKIKIINRRSELDGK